MSHPTHHFVVKRSFGKHGWDYVNGDTATLDECISTLIDSFDGDETGVVPSMDTVLVLEIDSAVAINRTEDALSKIAYRTTWRTRSGGVGTNVRAYLAGSDEAEEYGAVAAA